MREWLSWWSTTLPRSGSRVRVPSRALEKMSITTSFFLFGGLLSETRLTKVLVSFIYLRRKIKIIIKNNSFDKLNNGSADSVKPSNASTGNKSVSIQFSDIPETLDAFQALPQAAPHSVTLRKAKDGKWYLWEQFLLPDIRQPESLNPWA